MKRLEILIVIKVIFTFICLINLNAGSINAQPEDEGITSRRRPVVNKSAPVRNPGIIRKPAPIRVVKSKPVFIPVKELVKPTALFIATEPNAEIILETVIAKKAVTKKYQADADGKLSLEKLKEGKYKLSVSLVGYQPQETDIEIKPQKMRQVDIDLEKVKYNFSIQTNVDKGEVRFAPVKIIGEPNPDGTLNVQETGGYCIVPIENKKAVIKELAEGNYNLDVRAPDAPEYQPEESVIRIPQDIPEKEANELNEKEAFTINLENTQSINTFISSVKENWTLPENWKMDGVIIKANGAGLALPKDKKTFGFYKDFEMQSNVRLPDNASAGFVLRVKDKNNYYLIQFTGKTTKDPFMVSGIIVKDGKPTAQVMSVTTKHVIEKAVNEQMPFEVVIKAEGNRFKVSARDETGKLQPLGDAIFKDNNYSIGAVGIGALENSGFEVNYFVVCNQVCQ